MSRAVDRITALLEVIAIQPQPPTLSEISEATGLDKSTVFRFLQACEQQQIVQRDPVTLRYSLGIRIIEWSGRALDKINIAKIADPVLARLNLETQETVALYLREGRSRTAIVVYNSPHTMMVYRRLGSTAPLALGAAGKAILGFIPVHEAHETLDKQADLKPGVRERIRRELPGIRSNGFATSMKELSDHAWSVAAPVFGANREPIASIGISSPGDRYSARIMTYFAELVVPAANEVTRLNGGTPISSLDRPAEATTTKVDD